MTTQLRHSRLIEQQDMRRVPPEFREHHAGLLPVAELGHLLHLHLAADAEPPEVLALLLPGRAGVDRVEELEGGLLEGQHVDEVLGEPPDLEVAVRSDVAHAGKQLARHELD